MAAGRPKLQLDERQIEELSGMQCTMIEIAKVMGCHVDTLRDNYSNAIEKGRESGKSSLRRIQWNCAESGGQDGKPNATMCIWLGKQYLGQREPNQDLSRVPDEILAAEVKRRIKSREEFEKTAA